MDKPTEAPRAEAPPRPRRRIRRMLRVACIPVLLLLAAGILLATMPLSWRFLDRKVSEAWLRETGLDLAFENATYYLAQGRLEVNGVAISDHESGERLLDVGRIELRWNWRLRSPGFFDLAAVDIIEPAVMTLSLQKGGGLRPDARLHAFIQLFQRLAERSPKDGVGTGSGSHALRALRSTISVRVANASLALSTGGTERRLELNSTDVSFLYRDALKWRIRVAGRLVWADGRPVVLAASFEPGRPASDGQPRARMSLRCGEMDLRELLPLPQGLALACGSLSADGVFGWEKGHESLAGDLTLHGERVSATLADGEVLVPPFPLLANLNAALDPARAALEVRSLELSGLASRVRAQGRLDLAGEGRYVGELGESTLSCDALNVLLAGLLPETVGRMTFWNGSMSATARMVGDRQGPDWAATSGTARAAGLEMTLERERRNLGPLEVEADWSSGTLRLTRGDLRVGQSALSAKAEIADFMDGWFRPAAMAAAAPTSARPTTAAAPTAARPTTAAAPTAARPTTAAAPTAARPTTAAAPTAARPMQVRASWNVALQAEDLLDFLPAESLPSLRRWEPRGSLTGQGAVEGSWAPTSATAATPGGRLLELARQALETLKMDGSLVLADASVNHPILPGPLRGVAGVVRLTNRSVDCTNLTGEMLKSSVSITASVTGEKAFWESPRLAVKAKGRLDLEHLPEVLESEGVRGNGWMGADKRALFKQLLPQGEASFDLSAQGPLLQPSSAAILGDIRLTDVACLLDSDVLKGKALVRSARVRLLADRVVIENLRGSVGAVDLATSGTIGARHSELLVAVATSEENLRDAAPWLFRHWTEIGGSARVAARLTADLRPDGPMRPPASPAALAFAAVDRRATHPGADPFTPAWFQERFTWGLAATADAQDLVYSHAYLPGVIRGISGRFVADRHQVATDGFIHCSWGRSPDGLASVTLNVARVAPAGGPPPDLWDMREGQTYPVMRFSGHFPTIYLNEWIKAWGPSRLTPEVERPTRPAAPGDFDPSRKDAQPKNLLIQGHLAGDVVHLGNYEFQNASCLLSDRLYPNRMAFIELENMRGDLYGGHLDNYASFLLPHHRLNSWVWDADGANIDSEKLLAAAFGGKPTMSGRLTGRMHLTGVEDFTTTYLGTGEFRLRDSRFMGNPIFAGLGHVLGSQDIENISFTQMNGTFRIAHDRVELPDLRLDGPLMNLVADGSAGFDKTLNLTAVYQFLSITDRIPVVSQVVHMVSFLGGHFLKVHMGGTFQKPEMQPVPLSVDELQNLLPSRRDTVPTSASFAGP